MKSKLLSLLCLALVVTVVSAGEKQHDETLTEDLLLAAVNKKVEDTKSLLARNANPNAVNKEGTPLLMAVLLSMQFDAKELASGTISGDRQCSETVQITKHLLDAGANPNATNQEGDPVLMAAFTRGDPGIVADLIRAGASVKGVDSKGSPLFVAAAFSTNQTIVELMLAAGADVNEQTEDGTTALLAATNRQKWELSRFLIQKGAAVNARLDVGTPLLFAAAGGDLETVKLLVAKGADVNGKNNQNISPLSIAMKMKHQQVVKFLKAVGAKP